MAVFSAFQSNAFQSNAFQILRDAIAPIIPVSRGGVADYRHYRKRLKKIAAAADRRLYNKVEKKIAAIVESAPIEIKQEAVKIQSTIDFGKIAQNQSQEIHTQLIELIKKLDLLVEQAILKQQNEEDELILIMALA